MRTTILMLLGVGLALAASPTSGMVEAGPATDAITIPHLLSYQGKLLDNIGNPVIDTTYSVLFSLYTVPSGGSAFWSETQTVRTKAGLFSVLLGSVTPIGSLPDAGALYLGMKVGADPEMTPRLRIVSAAYAHLAERAANSDLLQGRDTSYFLRSGQPVPSDDWVRGTPDSVLYTVNRLGIARGGSNNMLHGSFRQSHVNFGVNCTTGASGQDYSNVTVSGGLANTARAGYSTVGGGWLNRANGAAATVPGGAGNLAGGDYAVVGGGFADTTLALCGGALSGYMNKAGDAATDSCATVAGGYQNRATGKFAFVGGGYGNTACSSWSTVGGGTRDTARGRYSTVGGGFHNVASGPNATVAGGSGNDATGDGAFVGGGNSSVASGAKATVGGGDQNNALGDNATVSGGRFNHAAGSSAAIGGGSTNDADSSYTTVCGGIRNHGWGAYATIGGGYENVTRGDYSVVGGGDVNGATAANATVGGGHLNDAMAADATVGGGSQNTARAQRSTVAGGMNNDVTAAFGSIAGGSACKVFGNSGFAAGDGSIVDSGHSNSAALNGTTTTASSQLRCGTLSKAGGSFTIDHPLDPQGTILNHYFVESPQMPNLYYGSVVLGADGRAEVSLPDYFSALNRNPLVQLTGVGTSDVYLAEDVIGNRFVVGGKPGTKVYWTAMGERKDVSAEAIRRMMPVEQRKTGMLAGKSLDDEFLSGCMEQLVREGKAQGIDFRTAAGRQRYEEMKRPRSKTELPSKR